MKNPKRLRARHLAVLNGQRISRWPVTVTVGELASLTQENLYPSWTVDVIAPTAQAAADLVAAEVEQFACTQLEVWGPHCGLAAHRYWGWDRAIYSRLTHRPTNLQLNLNLA